ncbi:hypothetical protein [Metapseudomonas otitidis]|uniref:Uncharacterized protein n=1 Tax=Metapseudomonas otitidis TaxID=319939 RepID=A0A679GQM0_9GAMM|nr:hypothetical protein [Pseudomonas otitidis]BCA28344.1 hypothetical protein PtoMrB4_23210 [Pseudomonas otitidis]
MSQDIVIRSEDDAFAVIQEFLNGSPLKGKIELDGWPKLRVRLVGEKFDQTITPTVMKSFLELQGLVYKSYALSQYGSEDVRRLSKEERDELEIQVKVDEGSSIFEVDFQELLMKFAEKAGDKMSPELMVATVLGLGVLWVGKTMYSEYIASRKEIRLAEVKKEQQRETLQAIQEMSKEESKRHETLVRLMTKQPVLVDVAQQAYDAKTGMLKGFSSAESATVGDITISGEAAQEITTNARRQALEKRLDGYYRILKVDSSNPEEFKVRVRRNKGSTEFDAILQDDFLDATRKEILQYAEWERTTVYLNVNAKILDDKIRQATIIDVLRSEPPAE